MRSVLRLPVVLLTLCVAAIAADDSPTAAPIKEPQDFSNTLQTRLAIVEKMLGISTTSWRCHFPKGYTVRFTWLQEGIAEPRWTSTLDTDTLPSPDGYFLTLYTQHPPSRPAEDKSPTRAEIGFQTPYEGATTYFYYQDTTRTEWGASEPKVGEDFVLWTVHASLQGEPKPLLKMIMWIDRN